MPDYPELHTARLHLRLLEERDLPLLAAMHADPRVMEFLFKTLDRAESDAVAQRDREHFERHGFGRWGVEVIATGQFVGLVGLKVPNFEAHFTPCVEVGWRLAHEHWGHGYATEAAQAALDFAFGPLGLAEVVSFTTSKNLPSRRLMERLGMTRSPADDFDHPNLPADSSLRRHVLYRRSR